ncbi:MAG: tetratricopeptide repeat protein [Calditrichaeota bacterium]|nr:MAG: tetratricopeptide repeat protein [Calditrichota bacterium]
MDIWIRYLSGNVPGGIYLYLVVLAAEAFILLFLYRASELFTRRHLVRWSLICFVASTLGYAFLWLQNPPPRIVQRYGVMVDAESESLLPLSLALDQILGEAVASHQGGGKVFFRPWWFHFAGLPCDSAMSPACWQVARTMPIHQFVYLHLVQEGQSVRIVLQKRRFPSGKVTGEATITVPGNGLQEVWRALQPQLDKTLPLTRNGTDWLKLPLAFFRARHLFHTGRYGQARERFAALARQAPEEPMYRQWRYYAQIRLAARLRRQALNTSGIQTAKNRENQPWVRLLREAQAGLLEMARRDTAAALTNVRLNLMIGEAFLTEEKFDQAEPFLKQAYALDPYDAEVLEDLVLLHPSRYQDLGFADRNALYEYLLTVCPLDEDALIDFGDQKLIFGPHLGSRSLRARDFLQHYLEMVPTSARAWNLMGKYYYLTLDRKKALEAFFRADSLDPHNPVIKFNIGATYFHQNRLEEAERYFKEAIALDDYLDAHLYLGEIYRRRGDCRRALAEYRYRVRHKTGEDDYYALQAMKGIRMCLEALAAQAPKSGERGGSGR